MTVIVTESLRELEPYPASYRQMNDEGYTSSRPG